MDGKAFRSLGAGTHRLRSAESGTETRPLLLRDQIGLRFSILKEEVIVLVSPILFPMNLSFMMKDFHGVLPAN